MASAVGKVTHQVGHVTCPLTFRRSSESTFPLEFRHSALAPDFRHSHWARPRRGRGLPTGRPWAGCASGPMAGPPSNLASQRSLTRFIRLSLVGMQGALPARSSPRRLGPMDGAVHIKDWHRAQRKIECGRLHGSPGEAGGRRNPRD
jgi:hypothetical protein